MPAQVDHDDQRARIAEIAAGLIAEGGLEAATVRQVAAATGCSTTIVTHYFASKRQLLLHAYQAAVEHAQARVDAALARDPRDLAGCMHALMPISDEALRDWRVYVAFWQMAVIDPEFAREQSARQDHARKLLVGVLGSRGVTSPAALARRLLTILQGISVQAVFDPIGWSAREQKRFLKAELAALLPASNGT